MSPISHVSRQKLKVIFAGNWCHQERASRCQSPEKAANVDSIVKRSICGHATEEMSQLYSTVRQKEIQKAVGKVISLAGYREVAADTAGWCASGCAWSKTGSRRAVGSTRHAPIDSA